jgi:hypothetical protein
MISSRVGDAISAQRNGMLSAGEKGEKPTWLPTTCRHFKVILPPFAVGKVRTSLSQMSVAASPRKKTKTLLFKVRGGQIFANRFEFDLKPDPIDNIGEL